MDFSRRNRIKVEEFNEESDLEKLLPHNVCMYLLPPTVELSISEFEELALERLKVLRIFEQASAKNLKTLSEEWKESVRDDLNHEGLKGYARLTQGNHKKDTDMAARRRDYLSHFILRFAYCRSEELRRWFVSREMELFKLKFSGLSTADIKEFVEVYDMKYVPLTQDEKDDIKDGLYESTSQQSVMKIETMDFYKVKFTDVLDLVRNRRCFLKGGYAYVSTSDFVSIIGSKHQQFIEDGLQSHLRLLPELENDERFSALLKGLHTSYTGKDYTLSKTAEVPIESLDQLSKKSFPLCMRYAHETVRAKHNLKHGGRMQYGLFLKAIGVSLEDSMRFWREEITKIKPLDVFEKQYAYNIRHNYGKEGSRINYTPYSCMKIITTSVGPQDTHGCPFKFWEPVNLKTKLTAYGLSMGHIEEIISYVTKGHYQIACGKYFEVSHQSKLDEGVNHPNQYFEISQITMGNRQPKTKQPPKPNRKGVANSQDIVLLKKHDTTTLNAADDDELWRIMESSEVEQTQNDTDWHDDGFDVSHIEC